MLYNGNVFGQDVKDKDRDEVPNITSHIVELHYTIQRLKLDLTVLLPKAGAEG